MEPSPEARDVYAAVGPLFDERRFVEAIPHAERAIELAPDWAWPWSDLTVAYKHACRWQACLDACDRAIALDVENSEGANWNAGIAATALGNWARARRAWRDCGITIPDGEGPLRMELGAVPIRVSRDDQPEVVWCDRIDPCRAIIRNVPTGEHRGYGDLVLHDGEPRGERKLGKRTVSVFDELAVLEPGRYARWDLVIECNSPREAESVLARFEGIDGEIEDWTANFRVLCRACSEGSPGDHDHGPSDDTWKPLRRFGLALRDEAELDRLYRRKWLWKPKIVELHRLR